jgi:hypothetical protein
MRHKGRGLNEKPDQANGEKWFGNTILKCTPIFVLGRELDDGKGWRFSGLRESG